MQPAANALAGLGAHLDRIAVGAHRHGVRAAILYRVPKDGAPHTIDDARPFSVISATGKRAHFIGWRKVGRRRLGIGIGSPPVERV